MALKFGYKICPVLVMNEHKMFATTDFAMGLRMFLNKVKLPGTVYWGRFGVLPDFDIDLVTVVGKPVELPLIEDPSREEVEKWHEVYVGEMSRLYEKYKHLNQNTPL